MSGYHRRALISAAAKLERQRDAVTVAERERDEAIRQAAAAKLPAAELAEIAGISRQRVGQIVAKGER